MWMSHDIGKDPSAVLSQIIEEKYRQFEAEKQVTTGKKASK